MAEEALDENALKTESRREGKTLLVVGTRRNVGLGMFFGGCLVNGVPASQFISLRLSRVVKEKVDPAPLTSNDGCPSEQTARTDPNRSPVHVPEQHGSSDCAFRDLQQWKQWPLPAAVGRERG